MPPVILATGAFACDCHIAGCSRGGESELGAGWAALVQGDWPGAAGAGLELPPAATGKNIFVGDGPLAETSPILELSRESLEKLAGLLR